MMPDFQCPHFEYTISPPFTQVPVGLIVLKKGAETPPEQVRTIHAHPTHTTPIPLLLVIHTPLLSLTHLTPPRTHSSHPCLASIVCVCVTHALHGMSRENIMVSNLIQHHRTFMSNPFKQHHTLVSHPIKKHHTLMSNPIQHHPSLLLLVCQVVSDSVAMVRAKVGPVAAFKIACVVRK